MVHEIFIIEIDKSIRKYMRAYWALRKRASFYVYAFYAASLLKLRERQEKLLNCQADVQFQSRQFVCHACDNRLNVNKSSEMVSISIWQEPGADTKQLNKRFASSMVLFSSTDLSTQQPSISSWLVRVVLRQEAANAELPTRTRTTTEETCTSAKFQHARNLLPSCACRKRKWE